MEFMNSIVFLIQIIDDSESENAEQFKLELTRPSNMAELGDKTTAIVTISGPNDGWYGISFLLIALFLDFVSI